MAVFDPIMRQVLFACGDAIENDNLPQSAGQGLREGSTETSLHYKEEDPDEFK
jgi:hypothetical protein